MLTQGEWYQALDVDKKQAIRQLHRLTPAWNLVGALFVLIWALTAALMLYFDSWVVRIPGYIVIGTLIHGMANIMHEGIHGTLFRNRRWDRWWGFAMGAPSLFSLTAYGVNHLRHHKYTRTARDPDEFKNITPRPLLLSIFFYLWIAFGMMIYSVRVPFVAWTHAHPGDRRKMLVERGIMLLVAGTLLAAAWQYNFFGAVVQVWLIPLGVAAFLGNLQGWAEHAMTQPGHPLTETRTVTSNRLFSFFNINLNYHLEHHLFPGVPWYNLPKVHRILRDDYRTAGASVYRSYVVFVYDACRVGIHGLTPTQA